LATGVANAAALLFGSGFTEGVLGPARCVAGTASKLRVYRRARAVPISVYEHGRYFDRPAAPLRPVLPARL
jgi:hypothetical protein